MKWRSVLNGRSCVEVRASGTGMYRVEVWGCPLERGAGVYRVQVRGWWRVTVAEGVGARAPYLAGGGQTHLTEPHDSGPL